MFAALGALELFIIFFFFITPFVLCIISLVDVLRSTFEGNSKIIWVLTVILLPFAGAILYFFIGRKQKTTSLNYYQNR